MPYSSPLRDAIDELYFDVLEGRNIKGQLNRVFEIVLRKQVNDSDTVPSLFDIHKS